jgi:hypothetical protein
MHIGISTSTSKGGAVARVFDSKRGVRDSLANSPLWEASRSISDGGDRAAVIRTRWTHGEFERCMNMRGRAGRVVVANALPVTERHSASGLGFGPGPAADKDVIGPVANPYNSWPREKSTFR